MKHAKNRNGRSHGSRAPVTIKQMVFSVNTFSLHSTNTKRAFFMGNALVCGIVSKIAESILFFENKK